MPDPPELHEDVDLEMEWRRYIIEMHARLDALDHYQTLGVARDADRKTLKEAYRAALAISPNDPDIKAAFEETQRASAEKLVDAHRKKAVLEERFGRWAEAADAWQKVLVARPDDLEVRERLAQALARAARGG